MTCIVGYKYKKKAYIGGDSAGVGTEDLSLRIRNDHKVFKTGKFIMGFTSSFRMGQLLMYKLKVPAQKKTQKDYEYMVTTFIDAVRKCLTDGGFSKNDNGEESAGSFIVAYKGELYTIYDDYQVEIAAEDYTAVGCGDKYALGALKSIESLSCIYSPEEVIQIALHAAECFSAGVAGPYNIINEKGGIIRLNGGIRDGK